MVAGARHLEGGGGGGRIRFQRTFGLKENVEGDNFSEGEDIISRALEASQLGLSTFDCCKGQRSHTLKKSGGRRFLLKSGYSFGSLIGDAYPHVSKWLRGTAHRTGGAHYMEN
jgi:hypothetical protein